MKRLIKPKNILYTFIYVYAFIVLLMTIFSCTDAVTRKIRHNDKMKKKWYVEGVLNGYIDTTLKKSDSGKVDISKNIKSNADSLGEDLTNMLNDFPCDSDSVAKIVYVEKIVEKTKQIFIRDCERSISSIDTSFSDVTNNFKYKLNIKGNPDGTIKYELSIGNVIDDDVSKFEEHPLWKDDRFLMGVITGFVLSIIIYALFFRVKKSG